jgi:hypothetical protein
LEHLDRLSNIFVGKIVEFRIWLDPEIRDDGSFTRNPLLGSGIQLSHMMLELSPVTNNQTVGFNHCLGSANLKTA